MNTLSSRLLAGVLALAALVSFSGCAVVNSHSESKFYGTPVSDVSLAQVEIGTTTAAWLVATLGQPAARERVDDQVEILKYSSRQLTKINTELLFVIDASSEREVRRTVFFECADGLLTRYWIEETEVS